jgi:hypothetical protein
MREEIIKEIKTLNNGLFSESHNIELNHVVSEHQVLHPIFHCALNLNECPLNCTPLTKKILSFFSIF